MKEKFGQFKEFVGRFSRKTIALVVGGAVVLIAAAIVIAVVLNNRPYTELFSGLGQEEAQQIVQKLQEDGIDYRFNGESTIMVKKDVVDQTKATLVQEGYPKSGFTYDTFKDNAGMLTTDSDKNTYKLYELQDRIGATIRLFDGVKDAKVTIALGEESRYALNDEGQKSSATAVVTMNDGGSPTAEQAVAIQRLVSKSIPEMELEDVAVFDGNGNDVSLDSDSNSLSGGSTSDEIAQILENAIANNVMKVLGPIYGYDNVRVSAKAKVNMEKLVRESTTYTTPDKIDAEDKSGIVSHEELYNEQSGTGDGAGGVAGTETNADATEYNTDGTTNGGAAASESTVRDYLVNQVIEQGQIDPGNLDDLTVAVAINGNGYGSLRENQLRSLVGNAAGIASDVQEQKITIVSAPFDGIGEKDESKEASSGRIFESIPLWALIAAIALILVLIAVVVILILRRRNRQDEEEIEEFVEEEEESSAILDINEEIQEMQNDRSMELKRSVREFAEQNAEISAQLLKNWLNGGVGSGGE